VRSLLQQLTTNRLCPGCMPMRKASLRNQNQNLKCRASRHPTVKHSQFHRRCEMCDAQCKTYHFRYTGSRLGGLEFDSGSAGASTRQRPPVPRPPVLPTSRVSSAFQLLTKGSRKFKPNLRHQRRCLVGVSFDALSSFLQVVIAVVRNVVTVDARDVDVHSLGC